MIERLVVSNLSERFPLKPQLEDLRYKSGSLEFVFSSIIDNSSNKLKVVFDWVHSFRVTDEGDLLKMQYEQKGLMLTSIYVVENSKYIKWFNEQSGHIHDDVVHYMFSTVEDVIDVLSSVKPSLEAM